VRTRGRGETQGGRRGRGDGRDGGGRNKESWMIQIILFIISL
jgi:hypothetical protein